MTTRRSVLAAAFLTGAALLVLAFAHSASAQCEITHQQKLFAQAPQTNVFFGDELARFGDVAIVGAQFDDHFCPEDPSDIPDSIVVACRPVAVRR